MNIRRTIRNSILLIAFIAVGIAIFYVAFHEDELLQLVSKKLPKNVLHYTLISIIIVIFLAYIFKKYFSRALSQSRHSKRDEIAMEAMRARHERLEEKVRKLTAELSAAKLKLEAEIENRPQDQRELHQRLQHLNCLYGLSKIVNRQEIPLDKIFQKTICLIREAFRYPNAITVRVIFDGIRYESNDFKKSESSRRAKIKAHAWT